MIYGIDPGRDGALAAIDLPSARNAVRIARLTRMPCDLTALAMTLRIADDVRSLDLVVLEAQSAMPRQGRTSIASQMTRYGQIQGCCAAFGLPVVVLYPVKWRRLVGCRIGAPKAASVALAMRLPGFAEAVPSRTGQAVLVGMAEAALIGVAGAIDSGLLDRKALVSL